MKDINREAPDSEALYALRDEAQMWARRPLDFSINNCNQEMIPDLFFTINRATLKFRKGTL